MPKNATTGAWGVRKYDWQGRPLLSVTSLRSLAGKPIQLVSWMVSQVARAAVENIDEFHKMVLADPEEARKWIQRVADNKRDVAASLGSAVHQAIHEHINPEDIADPEMAGMMRQGYDALDALGLKILLQEEQCWNLTLGYAGQIDLVCEDENGRVILIDWKSGAGVYAETAIQLVLYKDAEFIGDDDVIDPVKTAILKSVTDLAILHIRQNGWEYLPLKRGVGATSASVGMVAFGQWTEAHPDIKSVIDESKVRTFGDLS